MPSGRLGTADLAASTNTTTYTVPGATFSVVNISLCNRTSASITVRLAIAATSTPAVDEYIEFGTVIPANGVLERTGIVMSATNRVIAFASAAGVTAMVFGIET
jgi:hypothetical protein